MYHANNAAANSEYDDLSRLGEFRRGTLNVDNRSITADDDRRQIFTLDQTGNWAGFQDDAGAGGEGNWDLLAPFGFRPSEVQPRFARLGLALKGRTLYYCSYPMWQAEAHLMSYNIDTATVTDHGPIVCEDGRRVSEIHSMVVGSDGALHCAAMVWSIEGKDPAKPWGNRAQCYFHARFLKIDPAKDYRNQGKAE